MLNKIISWFTGEPLNYLECNKDMPGGRHPMWAREEKLTLLPEQEGWDFYDLCTLCGKEWHAKTPETGR